MNSNKKDPSGLPAVRLAAGAGCTEHSVHKLVHGLGLSPSEDLAQPDNLAALCEENAGCHGLLLFRDPAARICDLVLDGVDPDAAARQWLSEISGLLDVYENSAGRLTLVNLEAALIGFDRLVSCLSPRVRLEPDRFVPPVGDMGPSFPALLLVLAGYLLHSDVTRNRVMRELQAAALPLEPAIRIDQAEFLRAYRDGAEALPEDPQLLAEQQMLAMQLAETQQELENLSLDSAAVKSTLTRVENNLAEVYRSLSWRITAPMRWLLGLAQGSPGKRRGS